jgi:PRC-barrel domain
VEPASLPEGEVWWHEVVGTPVTDMSGDRLGTVADIYRAGAAEVLVVRDGPLGELDIPNVAMIVREFAPREGRIVVDVQALDPEPPAAARPRGRRTTRAAAAVARPEVDEAGEAMRSRGPADPAAPAGPDERPVDATVSDSK